MIININSIEHFNETILNNDLILIKFSANWCAPCKLMDKVLEELSADSEETVIVKVDVDQFPELAGEFTVMSIPTSFVVKDQEAVAIINGVATVSELKDIIAQA